MPIKLSEIGKKSQKQAIPKRLTPLFFSSSLTGNGVKKTGFLQPSTNPVNIPKDMPEDVDSSLANCRRHTTNIDGGVVKEIPFSPVTVDLEFLTTNHRTLPDTMTVTCIGSITRSDGASWSIYTELLPWAGRFKEVKVPHAASQRSLDIVWDLRLWAISDDADRVPTTDYLDSAFIPYISRSWVSSKSSFVEQTLTANPAATIMSWAQFTTYYNTSDCYADIDYAAINNYISTYNTADGISHMAGLWQNRIADIYADILDNQETPYDATISEYSRLCEYLAAGIAHLEDYQIPLENYRRIYDVLKRHCDDGALFQLSHASLNMLLVDTLSKLAAKKDQLIHLPVLPNPPAVDPKATSEQKAAITTTDPLVMIDSVAGSGKTRTLLARIKYLRDCGVSPEDITVLSFTNAAADHVSELNPNVNSMTIAAMLNAIYMENFADQQLADIKTLLNVISIRRTPTVEVINFKELLKDIDKGDTGAWMDMTNFIERNYDFVISLLNDCKMTTLELESIICYLKIDDFEEPDTVSSRFLILDEVQDNSIFEFIYVLRYVSKHNESLYLVGDPSQTLFEFRASNPRAINVLESSGAFACYKLQTNFRSNQEILDFANVLLSNIEANQYANLRLHANSLAKVTSKSFQDAVKLDYERLHSLRSDLQNMISDEMATDVGTYIEDCLTRNEQVCLLAYQRRYVDLMQEAAEKRFPNASIVNICPDRPFFNTIFSTFIARYWNEVQFGPQPVATIQHEISNHIDQLVKNPQKAAPRVKEYIFDWSEHIRPLVANWLNAASTGTLTRSQVLEYIQDDMLKFENQQNAKLAQNVSRRNADRKTSDDAANANIIISTIHSAKGLEWDNTVVLMRAANNMTEADKRMYYVALTRAMKSEYVLAYDTVAAPKVETDYQTIINKLEEAETTAGGAKA